MEARGIPEGPPNQQILCFLRSLPDFQWQQPLSQADLMSKIQIAVAAVQSISLTYFSQTFDPSTIKIKSAYLKDAIRFLCGQSTYSTLQALKVLLEDLTECKENIVVNLPLASIPVRVKSKHLLKTIVVSSISLILDCFDSNIHTEPIFVDITKLILFTLNLLPNCPFSEVYLSAMNGLIQKYRLSRMDQKTILYTAYPYLNQSVFKEAEICANGLANFVIQNMQYNRKIRLLDKINEYPRWTRGDCAIVVHLINSWPGHLHLDFFMGKISPRLARMMFDNSTLHYVMNIIRMVTKHMTFSTWHQQFIENILYNSSFREASENFALAFSECVALGIYHFGADVYEEARKRPLTYFSPLSLFYSIQDGCINLMDYRDDLDQLLRIPDEIIQRFAFKALCSFVHMDAELTPWHIENVKYYMECIPSLTEQTFCFVELSDFVSQIVIKANNILRYGNPNNPELEMFVDFMVWLFRYSMKNFSSEISERIVIADHVFMLTQCILIENSELLTALYPLNSDQLYGMGESLFYQFLVQRNNYFYDKEIVVQKVIKYFLVAKEVRLELILFLERWYYTYGPCNDAYIEALQNTGIRFLELSHHEYSFKKGILCLQVVLLHKSLFNQGPGELVNYIFNKWTSLIEQFNDANTDIGEVPRICGYTLSIFALLRTNYIDGNKPGQCFHDVVGRFKVLVRKIVTKGIVMKHFLVNHEELLVVMEELLMIIMDTCYEVLRNPYDDTLLTMMMDIPTTILDINSGTIPMFKMAYDLRLKIIELRMKLDDSVNGQYSTAQVGPEN